MIKISSVDKGYLGRTVLNGFSLDIAEGERVCLSGVSGCGKTTLLRLVGGVETPDSGTITIESGQKLSVVFQEDRLIPWRNALQNLLDCGAEKERALFCLKELGLSGEEQKLPMELSGGMRRRVAIARAFSIPATLYLLDEPVQGLDDGTAGRVLGFMQKELEGKTALIISHDEAETAALGTKLLRLSGPPLVIESESAL